jgi:hypothetical protein
MAQRRRTLSPAHARRSSAKPRAESARLSGASGELTNWQKSRKATPEPRSRSLFVRARSRSAKPQDATPRGPAECDVAAFVSSQESDKCSTPFCPRPTFTLARTLAVMPSRSDGSTAPNVGSTLVRSYARTLRRTGEAASGVRWIGVRRVAVPPKDDSCRGPARARSRHGHRAVLGCPLPGAGRPLRRLTRPGSSRDASSRD